MTTRKDQNMPPLILPAIHHLDEETSLSEVLIARSLGCAGALLIEMNGRDEQLDAPAVRAKKAWPDGIIGTNRLRSAPADAVLRDAELGLDATWTDDCGIHSRFGSPNVEKRLAEAFYAVRERKPKQLLFASVAFKTQAAEPRPGDVAARAAANGWIATTSGAATGSPPDVEKLRSMRQAMANDPRTANEGRLAVASGIDPYNVASLGKEVDFIIVATGIGRDFHHIDVDKLRRLVLVANGL
jgi:hypothetical protein